MRELNKFEDNFLTVVLDGKEYVIESIGHATDPDEYPSSHLCLNIRDCGDGCVRR